ncbi:MAG: hypothetical protein AB7U20_22860 [Planctomycetaceae bacterium]
MTRDCPSPGDSTTDLSGIERAERAAEGASGDDAAVEQWSPMVWDDAPPAAPMQPASKSPSKRRKPFGEERGRRQRLVVILLASYASAATIALLYLLVTGAVGRSHELESLPDVAPLKSDEFRYAPHHASLPPGHQLRIGESRRFGNILVEPLRVTKGLVEFVHFSVSAPQPHPESVPALKLWVRLTNLSTDQRIAPLDRVLLFRRDFLEDSEQVLTNNFIVSRDAPPPPSLPPADPRCLFVLDLPLTSDWNLKQQQLGVRLAPGESVETYLPSQSEGIDTLRGELVWRMHIRKGYNAVTGHGVTTLIEVAFNDQDIKLEGSSEATSG